MRKCARACDRAKLVEHLRLIDRCPADHESAVRVQLVVTLSVGIRVCP
jgi:hypothetical protein